MKLTDIDKYSDRLADLGTRLRAMHDADSATIQAELSAIDTMDTSEAAWADFREMAVEARRHFLNRGHQLLKAAQTREAAA